MAERPTRIAVLVAGMHRSGTSLLTQMLVGVGCDAPRTLMPADEHNETGYWESEQIAALNDAILESAGSAWDDWEPFGADWFRSPTAAGLHDRAKAIVRGEYADSRLLVLKDPRIGRVLPFWCDVMRAIGASPRILIPLRNPLEVADSLAARDTIPPSIGTLLWLRNVLDSEHHSRPHERVFVRYDDALANWQAVIERIGAAFGVAWPRRSTTAALALEAGISPALRHQVKQDALADPAVSRWTKEVFGVLARWARDDVHAQDEATLDHIRTALDDAAAVFRRPVIVSAKLGKQAQALEREVEARGEVIADRERQIDSLRRAVQDRDGLLERQRGELEDQAEQIKARDRAVAERDVRADALLHSVAERDARIERARAEMDTAVATRDATIAAHQRTIADHAARLDERAQRIDQLDRGASADAARISGLEHALAALRSSMSWRLTGPLRRISTALRSAMSRTGGAPSAPGRWRRLLRRFPLGAALRRRALARAEQATAHVPCGRVDLADLNAEAARNGGPVPILFDSRYYLENNADVREAGDDPLRHYLAHGAVEGRLPFGIASESIDPLIDALHRCDLAGPDAFAFHANLYRALHQDLADMDDAGLRSHYENNGRAEGRMCSAGAFLQDVCDNPREIPLDFNFQEYLDLYPDLQAAFGARPPLEALRHYLRSGRWEPRLHTLRADFGQSPRRDAPAAPAARPLCVLAHVYYAHLWPELAGYLANLPADRHDLHVNLVDTTFSQELLTQVRDDFPQARVYISPNVGRDIGGHFQLLRNIRIDDYPLYCLVHTKESPHMSKGEVQIWRRKLLVPLLGTPAAAAGNIDLMLNDAAVGMVASERCRYTALDDNPDKYFALLDRLGVRQECRDVDFLSGTMMFMRREVLARVYEGAGGVDLEPGDDKPLRFHRDGQWAHAIERVFAPVARDMGYRIEWRRGAE